MPRQRLRAVAGRDDNPSAEGWWELGTESDASFPYRVTTDGKILMGPADGSGTLDTTISRTGAGLVSVNGTPLVSATNVKAAYGAVGDGVADDTAAVAAALAAGGQLYFPTGTYLVTSPLVIAASDVALIGDGERLSEIRYSGAGATLATDSTAIRRNCRLENIAVRNLAAGGTALKLANAYRWKLRNVVLRADAGTTSVALDGAGDTTFSTYFNEFYGVTMIGSLASCRLDNNITGWRFFGGVFEGAGYALLAPGTTDGVGGCLFAGCAMQATGVNSGGVMVQLGRAGVSSPAVSHNTFIGCRLEPASAASFRMEVGATYNSILGGSFDAAVTLVDLAQYNIRYTAETTFPSRLPDQVQTGRRLYSGYYRMVRGGSTTNGTQILNTERAGVIEIPPGTVLDRVAVNVTTAGGAGSVFRLGARGAPVQGIPGAASLLADWGTIDSSTTGVKELTINFTVPTIGRLFLSGTPQVGTAPVVQVRLPAAGSDMDWNANDILTNGIPTAYTQTGVTGALPADFTTGVSYHDRPVAIIVRAA